MGLCAACHYYESIDAVNNIDYYSTVDGKRRKVKQSEFVRWLTKQGASFKDGSRHIKVYLNGRQSHLPRHPAAELKTGLAEGVKKQLGLK